ncbi:hypothetical protein [Halochromatium salexigens]|uniref:Phosphate-selective porin O and P n=1 Tax=Halochromatium salexigens TaxID=49447 RepID=A0AAJ0UCB5_HALSE|nr:hypothetical protein [Halochromatium salexigens]MBK5929004.1 hypothetical protein [Halochromatium salexigens]
MDRSRALLALLSLLLLSRGAAAELALPSGLQLHGFASQGAVHTSSNRFHGDSPETSLDFTEIGLNASWRLSPRLLLAGQVLSRRAGDMSDGWPKVDFALADINLFMQDSHRAGMRLGRLKNRLGLYNETRDVPFTHPGIFLPQVVYFDKVRNLVLATDGIQLHGELYQPFGTLSATLATGRPVVDENVEAALLRGQIPGAIEPRENSWLASLWFHSPAERIKVGLSGAAIALRQDWNLTRAHPRIDLTYWIASAQYNAERWSLSTEYMGLPFRGRDFQPVRPDLNQTSEGYYAQLTYRLRQPLELMLRYEEGFANRDDRDGRTLERQTQGLIPEHAGSSRILSLGLRWDVSRHWMLRTEYQRHIGSFILSEIENPNLLEHDKHWDLFAVQAAFRF